MKDPDSRERRLEELVASLIEKRAELVGMMEKARAHALTELGPEATGELSRLRLHPADEGSDTAEQETDLALCAAEAEAVEHIDAALRRAHAGRYGTCERCHAEIDLARLAALPETALCIDCAESLEEQRGRRTEGAPAVEEKIQSAKPQAGEEDLTVQRVREARLDEDIERKIESEPRPGDLTGAP